MVQTWNSRKHGVGAGYARAKRHMSSMASPVHNDIDSAKSRHVAVPRRLLDDEEPLTVTPKALVPSEVKERGLVPYQGSDALGHADNSISRSLGYRRPISQALQVLARRGHGYLLIGDAEMECGAKGAPSDATGVPRAPVSSQERRPPRHASDNVIVIDVTPTGARKRPATPEPQLQSKRSAKSLYGIRRMTTKEAGSDSDSEDERAAEGSPIQVDSAVKTRPPRKTLAAQRKGRGRRNQEVLLFQYTSAATVKVDGGEGNETIFDSDAHTLNNWIRDAVVVPGLRPTPRKTSPRDKWYSNNLIDFSIAVYLGDGERVRMGASKAIMTSYYYSVYIKSLRMHGEPRIAGERKSEMASAGMAYRAFSKACCHGFKAGTGRNFWESEAVYLPMHVDGDHWKLAVLTNLNLLHDLICGNSEHPVNSDGSCGPQGVRGRASRIIMVDSMRNRSQEESVFAIQHWIASMFMHSQGCKEEMWKNGMFRWVSPEGCLFTFPVVLAAVRQWMLPMVLPSPKQRDAKSCGPFTILSLYFLSWKHHKVIGIIEKEHAKVLKLENAFTDEDAKQLSRDLGEHISRLAKAETKRQERTGDHRGSEDPEAHCIDNSFVYPFVSDESKAAAAPARHVRNFRSMVKTPLTDMKGSSSATATGASRPPKR